MITKNYKKQQTAVYTLRINTAILNRVKELAELNRRSAAKQIEFMLEQSLKNK